MILIIFQKQIGLFEAVVERIDIKHKIYDQIFKKRKKIHIVSSNTSTIPLKSSF